MIVGHDKIASAFPTFLPRSLPSFFVIIFFCPEIPLRRSNQWERKGQRQLSTPQEWIFSPGKMHHINLEVCGEEKLYKVVN